MDDRIKRIGLIIPPGNVVFERESALCLPSEVAIYINRLSRSNSALTPESLLEMEGSIDRAAQDLAQTYPDVMVYGCTGGSFLRGAGRENDISKRIEILTGVPALTTTSAVLEALNSLGMTRITLVTPYPEEINNHEIDFLSQNGISVVHAATFDCRNSEEIRQVSSEQVGDLVLSCRHDAINSDGVFISCGNLFTMDRIADLEANLGVPVISSVQASYWAALKRTGLASRRGCGRLFDIGV